MQGDVRVARTKSGQGGGGQPEKGGQWSAPKTGEADVVPNDIRLQLSYCPQQRKRVVEAIECPAAHHGKVRQLRLGLRKVVGQDREFEPGVPPQFIRDVKAIFVEPL